jgi:hypothetical protein
MTGMISARMAAAVPPVDRAGGRLGRVTRSHAMAEEAGMQVGHHRLMRHPPARQAPG